MAAGSIVVDLLMRTGAFETDTDRASKRLRQLEKDIDKTAKTMGVALGAAVVGVSVAFDQLVKSVADFKDFEEIVGAPAEEFASLATAAAGAGVAMDSIAGATLKLTKGLVGVDDESQAAGAALKAIGIEVEAFKKLSPVQQYEAVGKALAKYADGAEKSAVAQALFGKTGAEQLKVFKALEEQGGRNVRLTQQQIEQADAYADAQALAIANLKTYSQIIALQFLPALTDVTGAAEDFVSEILNLNTASDDLIENGGLKSFADDIADAFAFVIDVIDGAVRAFQIAGKTIGGVAAATALALEGEFDAAKVALGELEAEIQRIASKPQFSELLDRRRQQRQKREEQPDEPDTRGKIDFNGVETGRDAARKKRLKDDEDAAKAALEVEEQSAKDMAEAWKIWEDYRVAESKAASDATLEQYRQWFAEIDAEQERAIEEGKALLETKSDELSEFMKQGMANIQDFVGESFADALEGNFDSIEEGFGRLVRRLIAQAAAAQLNEWLFGKKGNGGQLASVIGAIGGLFSGSGSTTAPSYTDSSGGFSMVPGYATGTANVPADGLAMLHKGEAVFPAEFNPFTKGGEMGGRQAVVIENHGADIEQREDPNGLVRLVVKLARQEVAAGIASGQGPEAAALKSRGLNLTGGIQRRA
jgi:hypothetical protein